MPRKFPHGKRRGFTRVDLLVSALAVLLTVSLLTPSLASVRQAAERATSRNNLKQIALANINLHDTNNKLCPALGDFFPGTGRKPNNSYGPCLFHLLPFIEEDKLFKASFTPLPQGPLYACWKGAGIKIKTYAAPGDPTAGQMKDPTSYLANGLAFPSLGPSTLTLFTDGTSNTILFAEGYARAVGALSDGIETHTWTVERRWWEDPVWIPYPSGVAFQVGPLPEAASASLPQGFTRSGIEVVMVDCSTHTVAPSCSAKTFYEACTPSGGETLGDDW
jgi:hypothetical protein